MRRIYFIPGTEPATLKQKIITAIIMVASLFFLFYFGILIIAFLIISGLFGYIFLRYKVWKMQKAMKNNSQFKQNYHPFENTHHSENADSNSRSPESDSVIIEGDFKKINHN